MGNKQVNKQVNKIEEDKSTSQYKAIEVNKFYFNYMYEIEVNDILDIYNLADMLNKLKIISADILEITRKIELIELAEGREIFTQISYFMIDKDNIHYINIKNVTATPISYNKNLAITFSIE